MLDAVGGLTEADFITSSPPSLRARQGLAAVKPTVAGATRYRIDPARRSAEARPVAEGGGEQPEANPAFFGRRSRFGYLRRVDPTGSEPDPGELLWAHSVQKADFEAGRSQVWNAGPGKFCGAPAFAARPGATDEDDGWLVVWVLDGETGQTEVAVLDARDVPAGPIATLKLERYIPLPGHSAFDAGMDIFD